LGAVADLTVGLAGRFPVLFLHQQEGVADPTVDPVAQREADVAAAALGGEPVRCPGRVDAHQQLLRRQGRFVTWQVAGPPVVGELVDGRAQHDDMISGAVGSRVARPEHPGQNLAGLGQHGGQRVMPIGALVGGRGVLLVAAGPHDRGVQIDRRFVAFGASTGRPRGGPGLGSSTGQTA
jgi:hypothetical protein